VSACVDSSPGGDNLTALGRIRRSTIEEAADDRLRRSGHLALRDIACDVRGGVVRLRGRLPTYYLKQVAQAIVAEVDGVIAVSNQIEVIAPGQLIRSPTPDRASADNRR
jgi:osmotically-inducible protein OsmY